MSGIGEQKGMTGVWEGIFDCITLEALDGSGWWSDVCIRCDRGDEFMCVQVRCLGVNDLAL